jgi:hypothetical protein
MSSSDKLLEVLFAAFDIFAKCNMTPLNEFESGWNGLKKEHTMSMGSKAWDEMMLTSGCSNDCERDPNVEGLFQGIGNFRNFKHC